MKFQLSFHGVQCILLEEFLFPGQIFSACLRIRVFSYFTYFPLELVVIMQVYLRIMCCICVHSYCKCIFDCRIKKDFVGRLAITREESAFEG